jgi:hypothetical protein
MDAVVAFSVSAKYTMDKSGFNHLDPWTEYADRQTQQCCTLLPR